MIVVIVCDCLCGCVQGRGAASRGVSVLLSQLIDTCHSHMSFTHVKVIPGKQELIDATSQTRHFHGFETGAKVPSAKDPSAESFTSSPLSVLSLPVNLYLICSKLFQ